MDSRGSWVSLCCSQVNKKLDLSVPQRPTLSPGDLLVTGEKVPLSKLRLWHHLCLSHAVKLPKGGAQNPHFLGITGNLWGLPLLLLPHLGVFNHNSLAELLACTRTAPIPRQTLQAAPGRDSCSSWKNPGENTALDMRSWGGSCSAQKTRSERSPLPGGSGLAGLRPMPPGPQSAAGQL